MHPDKDVLRLYVDARLSEGESVEVSLHVAACEFCREFCDEYRSLMQLVEESMAEGLPVSTRQLANRLRRQAIFGATVPLSPFKPQTISLQMQMAADSGGAFSPEVICLATLYSESPEIVLRVMRDQNQENDYLQLISEDPGLAANVMIRIPELNREFLTDSHGKATFDPAVVQELRELHWQIKMPDATFLLEPLVYDPDRKEYSKEVMLETERQDKIKVIFEGKTEGKLISIQVLELNGKSNFQNLRVSLLQDEESEIKTVAGNRRVTFDLKDKPSAIGIRLFAS